MRGAEGNAKFHGFVNGLMRSWFPCKRRRHAVGTWCVATHATPRGDDNDHARANGAKRSRVPVSPDVTATSSVVASDRSPQGNAESVSARHSGERGNSIASKAHLMSEEAQLVVPFSHRDRGPTSGGRGRREAPEGFGLESTLRWHRTLIRLPAPSPDGRRVSSSNLFADWLSFEAIRKTSGSKWIQD